MTLARNPWTVTRDYRNQPARLWASVSAATAAVSARRMRGPSGRPAKPDARIAARSSSVKPPSGPTSTVMPSLPTSEPFRRRGSRVGDQADASRRGDELRQPLRLGQRRRPASATLCHGRGGDPLPALHAGGVPAALHQARDHRHERGGAQLGRLLHRPVERLGVQHGKAEHQRRRGLPPLALDAVDLDPAGAPLPAREPADTDGAVEVEQLDTFARGDTSDARVVGSFRFDQESVQG